MKIASIALLVAVIGITVFIVQKQDGDPVYTVRNPSATEGVSADPQFITVPVSCVVTHLENLYPQSYEGLEWGEVEEFDGGHFQVSHRFRHEGSPESGVSRWINYDSTGTVTGIYEHVLQVTHLNGKPYHYHRADRLKAR